MYYLGSPMFLGIELHRGYILRLRFPFLSSTKGPCSIMDLEADAVRTKWGLLSSSTWLNLEQLRMKYSIPWTFCPKDLDISPIILVIEAEYNTLSTCRFSSQSISDNLLGMYLIHWLWVKLSCYSIPLSLVLGSEFFYYISILATISFTL